jgi:uncharacterized membrane protein YqgA involved in biofilm formation
MINPFLMTIIITVITGLVVIIIGVLVWLIRTHLKLKSDYQMLVDVVHSNNNDIADLCAAALTIDGRMAAIDEQISAVDAKISEHQRHNNEMSAHPYGLIIQKVRNGASVSELMQNSGLSQDEAALLIRLHGPKAQRP